MSDELRQLANALHVTEAELAFLESIEHDKIHFLQDSMLRAMQIEQAPMWSRIAKATALLPDRLTAKIAEGFLGAPVSANVTYHLPLRRAVSISKHFSLPFLAKTTTHLAAEKIEAFPIPNTLNWPRSSIS